MSEQIPSKHLTLVLNADTYQTVCDNAKSKGLPVATRLRQIIELYCDTNSDELAFLHFLLNEEKNNNTAIMYDNIIKDADDNCLPVKTRVKQILSLYYSGKLVDSRFLNANNIANLNHNQELIIDNIAYAKPETTTQTKDDTPSNTDTSNKQPTKDDSGFSQSKNKKIEPRKPIRIKKDF